MADIKKDTLLLSLSLGSNVKQYIIGQQLRESENLPLSLV